MVRPADSTSSAVLALTTLTLLLLLPSHALSAQANPPQQATEEEAREDTVVFAVDEITVTATRSPREVFTAPAPVLVMDQTLIARKMPNSTSDLFRSQPGLDVNGVGVNQTRPTIRGQRGQRILLLADGLRLNNSRRQQDFGEIPALVDVTSIQRVEVVRGPSSVLYGTDAIGGVVNMITRTPVQDGVHGSVGYRYGSVETQHRGIGRFFGRFGNLDLQAGFSMRDAGSYEAPSGTFGDIELVDDTPVFDTGVQDRSLDFRLGYQLSRRNAVWGKLESYTASDAGFGFVDPLAYAPDQAEVRIRYPNQDFIKGTVGYGVTDMGWAVADRLDFVSYLQRNERGLTMDIATSFGPDAPPGAGMELSSNNFTDLSTFGFRLEAKKLAHPSILVTYGVDMFRDDSQNTDRSVMNIHGFGPPMVDSSATPSVPNAVYRSIGAFAQGEFQVLRRGTLILGGRVQDIRAETRPTANFEGDLTTKEDRTAVGALNAIYEVVDGLSLVGSVGSAFRAPNIIEWFFEGPTPEGSGYQLSNPDLVAETSLNVDLGARFRSRWLAAEAFVFRNTIYDGIRIAPTGEEVNGIPAYHNVNVDELLYRGVELSATAFLPSGFSLDGSYTYLDSEDVHEPNNPVGETFATKITGAFRYDHPTNLFWAEYGVRHNGDQKDVDLGTSPIGAVLPAFTVHDVRGGIRLSQSGSGIEHHVGVTLANLTNELYAEFANASFFRPEAKRNLWLSYQLVF